MKLPGQRAALSAAAQGQDVQCTLSLSCRRPNPGMLGMLGMLGILGMLGMVGVLGMLGILGVLGILGMLGMQLPMVLPPHVLGCLNTASIKTSPSASHRSAPQQ